MLPSNEPAEWEHAEQLTPWRANPRKNEQAVERVGRSIQRFGWGAPVVARHLDGGGQETIAGHTRVKALLWLLSLPERVSAGADRMEGVPDGFILSGPRFVPLGIPKQVGPGYVPVRFMDHLSADDAHLLAVADNKLGEVATWDEEPLVAQLRALPPEQRKHSGHSDPELAALLADYAMIPGEAPSEIDDKGMQRFLVRVPIGQVGRAKELVLEALAGAGIKAEVGR